MSRWNRPLGHIYLADERFAKFAKPSVSLHPSWRMMAVKKAARELFFDLESAGDLSELWGVVASEEARIALDACTQCVPYWASEFERLFNEKARMMAGPIPMSHFEIKPAVRNIRNNIIGLVAPAGGGKTCSALRLATGLARGGEIVLIDTEYGKPTEFAPKNGEAVGDFNPENPLFSFKTISLDPPYSPDNYRAAATFAARMRPAVLIIDNFTFEHAGPGGQLQMRDAALAAAEANPRGGGDKFGWREPKKAHGLLMDRLMLHPWYVILCIRAKEKIRPANKEEIAAGIRGIVNDGFLPVCDGSLHSDCVMFQLLDKGMPIVSEDYPWRVAAGIKRLLSPSKRLDEETGRLIAEWAQPKGSWEEEGETKPPPLTSNSE
ncbi:hypothetical protein UFOVP1244_116 [uncultured Caudovirales phage]|uniref:AAA domain containing protein n=1 Tax=uncultured Caudovirales phage TaxID=2100421 RepID=A0A6J5R7H7_9CAUD|nr:hypothetical protein UFOVP1244_116 [uncultured Caudovirales phage]